MAKGTDIVELAAKHIGERYILGSLVPKTNPNWKGPWDCAEFISWCVYQLSTQLYGCNKDNVNPDIADAFTGFWARDAVKLGKKISIGEAKGIAGAAVLRIPLSNRTGHIVISDGKGGTVEAHSTNSGVIKSVIDGRRWDYGILVPWIDYTAQPVPIPVPPSMIYRYTQPMMKSNKVGEIQNALKTKGYSPGNIDNIFGLQTEAAVRAFQLSEGILVDGEVGTETAGKLGITL